MLELSDPDGRMRAFMKLSNHILLDWLKPLESLQKLRLLYQCAGPEMQWTFAA